MKLHAVAIRDIKANVFAQPYFVTSLGGAIRAFGDECQRAEKDNLMYKHPTDFELYKIGEYDDATGTLTPIEKEQLASGSAYQAN
ncbi:MAG: nonstructural protein [Microvirus sp.]|nr:MAG: nonstructural protein [Microvirus sp.]